LKIYTKTGDKGETSLIGGKRVPKDSIRIDAYGTVDELNTILGICRSTNPAKEIDEILFIIQNDLFKLGTILATPSSPPNKSFSLSESISGIEKFIDKIELELTPLKNFILPGGDNTASMLHLARAVCRRAERKVVQLSHEEVIDENILIYLNRLSDLLFVLARWSNKLSNTPEKQWTHDKII